MGRSKLSAVSDVNLCDVFLRLASRVSQEGTEAAEWDRNTWPELRNLAENHPEAGVHFQGRSVELLRLAVLTKSRDCTLHPLPEW